MVALCFHLPVEIFVILLNHLSLYLLAAREALEIGEDEVVADPQCTCSKKVDHVQDNYFSLHGFLDKTGNVFKYGSV